jgi:hypothetical protein
LGGEGGQSGGVDRAVEEIFVQGSDEAVVRPATANGELGRSDDRRLDVLGTGTLAEEVEEGGDPCGIGRPAQILLVLRGNPVLAAFGAGQQLLGHGAA